MSFLSIEFAILLPTLLVLLAWGPIRTQLWSVLFASVLFYAWWDWRYLGLLVISSVLDFVCALLADPQRNSDHAIRRIGLLVSVFGNLTILFIFKYTNFVVAKAAIIANYGGVNFPSQVLDVALPAGISFYTFQTMSYTLDVYRGVIPSTANPLRFFVFVCYFPQLVAGPIERAGHLLPQMAPPFRVGFSQIADGLPLILCGAFKKLVIADNMGAVVDRVFLDSHACAPDVLLAAYAFALQIWGDFSAYTDIARGSARMMGVELTENFVAPYLVTNPRDFWRHWHITLSTWFRDYVYIPLGGNRCGTIRTACNLAITMLLCGVWHGAETNFVLWGCFHATLLGMHRVMGSWIPQARPMRWLATIIMFHITCIGWIIFRAQGGYNYVAEMLQRLGDWRFPEVLRDEDVGAVLLLLACSLLMQACTLAAGRSDFQRAWHPIPRTLLYAGMMYSLMHYVTNSAAPFIYFQF